LKSFIPDYKDYSLKEIKSKIEEEYPQLKPFLLNLPYYYETNNYVITHAGLDFSQGDFRLGNWDQAVWTRSEYFFEEDLVTKYQFNKKVIVGHRFTNSLRKHFNIFDEDYSIYNHPDLL